MNKLLTNIRCCDEGQQIRQTILIKKGLRKRGYDVFTTFVNKKIKTKAFRINNELVQKLRSLKDGEKTEEKRINNPIKNGNRVTTQ